MEMKIPKLGWLAKEKAAWEQRDPAGSRADRKARNREREKEMGWNTRGEKLLFYFSMSFLILWNGRTKTGMRQTAKGFAILENLNVTRSAFFRHSCSSNCCQLIF